MSAPLPARYVRWGALWHSRNTLGGDFEHLLFENCSPVLFRTRREARKWIDDKYGYIRNRPDLKAEPHGWKIPTAVRVTVERLRGRERP
jgi:hypothetical protein